MNAEDSKHDSAHESPGPSGLPPDAAPTPPSTDEYLHVESELESRSVQAFGASGASDDRTVISDQPPLPRHGPSQGLHPVELGTLLEGEQLDHYRLEQFIGGGGMGAVFRSIDTTLGRTVAVKVLSTGTAGSEEMLRRFRNEAQSAARLDHENIARVYYVGEDRGIPYIVFEYIEGVNIRDLVSRHGPLTLSDSVEYTLQVAEALAHASQRDVVHRDIKPSNILITEDGRAKLVDMGLARLHQVEHGESDLTASGVTLGTFDYISPEQARDPRIADVRSDLYSLGCTFFFMLTGQPPFPDGTVLQKLLQHQGDEAPDVRHFRPGLPLEVNRILQKILAKGPEDRFQTPEEFIGELLILSRHLGLATPRNRRAVVVTSNISGATLLRRSIPWVVPICLFLAAVLILKSMGREEADSFGLALPSGQGTVLPSRTGVESNTENESPTAERTPSSNRISNNPDLSDAGEGPRGGGASADRTPGERGTNGPSAAPGPESATELETDSAQRDSAGSSNGGIADQPKHREALPDVASDRGPDTAIRQPVSVVDGSQTPPLAVSNEELPAAPEPPRARRTSQVLVVDPTGKAGTFQSLGSAVASARSDDVIKLDFNGSLDARPLELSGQLLTIRAGEGFRPRLVFHSSEAPSAFGIHRQAFVRVHGGKLRMDGVRMEVDLSGAGTPDGWAFFELFGVEDLHLESCVLTMRAADSLRRSGSQDTGDPVFFDITDAAEPQSHLLEEPVLPRDPTILQLKNCIARGDATLVRSESGQPVRLLWDNGLLVTSGRLFALDARPPAYSLPSGFSTAPLGIPEFFEVELRHLTAVIQSGMALVSDFEDAGAPIGVRIQATDCILATSRDAPLIDYRGMNLNAAADRFVWQGERNFYQRVRSFWTCAASDDLAPQSMDFVSWQRFWKSRDEGEDIEPQLDRVRWRKPPGANLPLYQRAPDDYRLSESETDNPAPRGASDGRDAGMDARFLPLQSEKSTLDDSIRSKDDSLPE